MEGAEGIPLHVLLLSSYLMSVPPVGQTQPDPEVRKSSHTVHGDLPPRPESRAEKGREWNGVGSGGGNEQ